MSIKHLCSFGAIAVALSMASGCAAAADSGQTIYLDPQTGEVIQHPAPKPPSAQSSQHATTDENGQASGKSNGYKRWKTRDGTQMLSVDPSHAPKERVVRCADGSLHMGTVGHGDGDATGQQDNENPEALCGQSAD